MSVLAAKKAVYRHGSTSAHPSPYEINSPEAVRTSASKLLMKQAFDRGNVKHLPWAKLNNVTLKDGQLISGQTTIKFPIVVKSIFGSRGNGNYKIDTPEEFNRWKDGRDGSQYIIEPFFSGAMEFRIHITDYGPIYSLRKLLKEDTPEKNRWYRNDSNCVWITEFEQVKNARDEFVRFSNQDNAEFDRPGNWNKIIEECRKALRAVGGDVMAVDVKTQSNKDPKGRKRAEVDFFILEVNSAPSMGNITLEIYKEHLPKILQNKYGNFKN